MIDERSRNEVSPKLLDLISNEREWNMNKSKEKCSEERKLELRLGPPSDEDWCEDKMKNINNNSYFSNNGFQKQNLSSSSTFGNNKASSFRVMGNDASQAKVLELQNGTAEKKVLSSPSSANTAVLNNTSQKRNAPGPLVGWPPIRSFRKNLASSSTCKPPPELSSEQEKNHEKGNVGKGLFVKINMDGVPIGRKVDLNAYNNYENLSSSVDQLFRGLLAGKRESSGSGVKKKGMMGLMNGSGEYTLVYEDNEGDRMLVGDVPWNMFLSTVKRIRVLKSTELSAITFGSKQEKIPT